VEQTTGDWADTKDGVSIWFPVFCWDRFCWDQGAIGRMLIRLYWRTSIGGGLLIDARRSSLAVQFGEKRFFLHRIAGPQQFQEWILRVGSGAARLA
jgi:hypothetical protein